MRNKVVIEGFYQVKDSEGPHYSVWHMDASPDGKVDAEVGMKNLKKIFPDTSKINHDNFVLFSTSGVHGCYTTIEQIEESLRKYGEDFKPEDDLGPCDWCIPEITVLLVFPRQVCLRCGVARVRLDDIQYIKSLRAASQRVMSTIGF